jgi:hypothetical protein
MSFGNDKSEIDFTAYENEKIVLIHGINKDTGLNSSNGSAKSAIIEAVIFALFDKLLLLAKGKVVPLLGSKEDSYNEAGIPTRTREPYPLPILIINDEFWNPDADLLSNLPHIQVSDFYVDNYQSHPTIKAPLSN